MVISQAELGARLKQAREAAGLTQDQVGREIGVPRTAVALMEGGSRSVSSLELDRLAFLYGRDMRAFFANEFGSENALAGLFRTNRDIAEDPDAVNALRRCMAVGRELTNLERLVGIDRDPAAAVHYNLPAPRSRFDAIRQGGSVAEQERRRLGIGDAPVTDVTELLEKHGVRTAIVDLPEDISGLTIVDVEAGPFVAANRREHLLRRNFSFAHEYAHVLLDCGSAGRISRGSERADLLEVRANSFAASLLLPDVGVREVLEALGKNSDGWLLAATPIDDEHAVGVEARSAGGVPKIQMHDVVLLSFHFGVSRQVVLYRLRNLRMISDRDLQELLKQEQAGQGRRVEKVLDLPEPDHTRERNRFRHRFLSLALEAHRREAISLAKLEELFATVLEKPRGEIALAEFGVVTDEAPTSVRIPT
jgi:Zn-dependent peptidase ImmA (M78 family)/transcriptional regulator with XRE-family HTH domain